MGMIQSSVNQIFSTAIKGVVGAMASEEMKMPKPQDASDTAMRNAQQVYEAKANQSKRFGEFINKIRGNK